MNEAGGVAEELVKLIRFTIRKLRNIRRRWSSRKIKWIYLDLDSDLPEREPPKAPWLQRKLLGDLVREEELSIESMKNDLDAFAELKQLKGLVIHLRTRPKGLGRLETLVNLFENFRKTSNKQVIFHSYQYDYLSYYLATSGSSILLGRGGAVSLIGLEMITNFFKDMLERYDFKFDAVPISPYKSAHEPFTRSDFSKEAKENREWLLDYFFDHVAERLARKLGKSSEEIRKIIDEGPYLSHQALSLGLVDAEVNEEEIPLYLEKGKKKPPTFTTWKKARKSLPLRKLPSKKKLIAVITIQGTIVEGKSRKLPITIPIPFISEEEVGDQTINALIREATRNSRIKAVVLHVNSPGGSVFASESMWASMRELVKTKPLVAYFNDVAASGGYYVSTKAQWIVAQPMTITGSIGVLSGKFITKDGLKKQGINRVYLRRGKRAGFWSDERPFTDEEREIAYKQVKAFYNLFLSRVSECRQIPAEKLDPICGGRVWTGEQAFKRGLVDQLGNIFDAIKKAAELAHLKEGEYRVINLTKATPRAPQFVISGSLSPQAMIEDLVKRLNKTKYWYLCPLFIQFS